MIVTVSARSGGPFVDPKRDVDAIRTQRRDDRIDLGRVEAVVLVEAP